MLDKLNPLWLPKGSVRAILALFIVVTGMAYMIATGQDVKDLVLLALGWYTIARVADKSAT